MMFHFCLAVLPQRYGPFPSLCHLPSEVSPISARGVGALIGNVFEGTLTPHGWTALGEPDKVGV